MRTSDPSFLQARICLSSLWQCSIRCSGSLTWLKVHNSMAISLSAQLFLCTFHTWWDGWIQSLFGGDSLCWGGSLAKILEKSQAFKELLETLNLLFNVETAVAVLVGFYCCSALVLDTEGAEYKRCKWANKKINGVELGASWKCRQSEALVHQNKHILESQAFLF